MNIQQAYNEWAQTYDTDSNKTRDLEARVIRQVLARADFSSVLETGCGTGKNTVWLAERAGALTAVDFSEEMMKLAQQKVKPGTVVFQQADLTQTWNFAPATLIACSLVLEHIENISFILEQAANVLAPGGYFYICELHPYKQLQGTRARFQQGEEVVHIGYFVHHLSDFFSAAQRAGLQCIHLQEWFDDEEVRTLPRLVSFIFRKDGL